jgi:hypothetical protein
MECQKCQNGVLYMGVYHNGTIGTFSHYHAVTKEAIYMIQYRNLYKDKGIYVG